MQALISPTKIEDLKNELGGLLPAVKASHRAEGMARGLGWNTYAAMRAELETGSYLRRVDEEKFRTYLTERGFPDTRSGVLSEAVLRAALPHELYARNDITEFSALLKGLKSKAAQPVLSGANDVALTADSMIEMVDQYIDQRLLPRQQTNDFVLLAIRDHIDGGIAGAFIEKMEPRVLYGE